MGKEERKTGFGSQSRETWGLGQGAWHGETRNDQAGTRNIDGVRWGQNRDMKPEVWKRLGLGRG